jgi:hypothetical protein
MQERFQSQNEDSAPSGSSAPVEGREEELPAGATVPPAGPSRLLASFPGSVLVRHQTVEELADQHHREDWQTVQDWTPRPDTDLELAWQRLLVPAFEVGESAAFHLTYSDEYGYPHGCMKSRNVERDWRRYLAGMDRQGVCRLLGVEQHPSGRKILHAHGLVAGQWSDDELTSAEALWTATRGWSRVRRLTDRDNAVRYAVKHSAKQGGYDNIYYELAPRFVSLAQQRYNERARRSSINHAVDTRLESPVD